MMRWRLNTLIAEYEDKRGERLTYERITEETGLSKTILSKMARNEAQRVDLATLDKLLAMFGRLLGRPVATGELLEHVGQE